MDVINSSDVGIGVAAQQQQQLQQRVGGGATLDALPVDIWPHAACRQCLQITNKMISLGREKRMLPLTSTITYKLENF